jgi:hypothetical protein
MITPTFYSGQAPSLPVPVCAPPRLRQMAVKALQTASAGLARTAARLEAASRVARDAATPPCVEFHAEAGALEGALYVDGVLVARLPGVRRL